MGLDELVEQWKVLSNPSGFVTCGAVPMIALLERWPVTVPVVLAYGIISYAVAKRSMRRYAELEETLQEKGFGAVVLYGETQRLARVWAEHHGALVDYEEALRQQRLRYESDDEY